MGYHHSSNVYTIHALRHSVQSLPSSPPSLLFIYEVPSERYGILHQQHPGSIQIGPRLGGSLLDDQGPVLLQHTGAVPLGRGVHIGVKYHAFARARLVVPVVARTSPQTVGERVCYDV